MNPYKIKIAHDNGATFKKIFAEDEQKAKEKIVWLLGCPMAAIQSIKKITEQEYYGT
jgi:hypothetical protein